MHASPSCPGPALPLTLVGLDKQMTGPYSFGSSPAQPAPAAQSAQPGPEGEGGGAAPECGCRKVHLQNLIDRLGGK